jgi:ESS family glutamate:Na+ symporter
MKLSSAHALGLACIALLLGYALRRALKPLERLNIPAPIAGGLVFALGSLALHEGGLTVELDTTLRDLLSIAFFTTVGLGARIKLLRAGGAGLLLLLAIASLGAVLQNGLGMAAASLFGVKAGYGIIVGSVTLAGGPSTALAFGPMFESHGLKGATEVGLASATLGIVSAGLLGNPLATWLMRGKSASPALESASAAKTEAPPRPPRFPLPGFPLAPELLVLVLSMGAGAWVSGLLAQAGFVLPAYIGAMIVAAVLRNANDALGWVELKDADVQRIGAVALNVFIAMAIVGLKLWDVAGLALPLLGVFAVQVVGVLVTTPLLVFWPFRRDYDAAVISSGYVGFMLGTTANAVANMDALVERFRPSPKAYLTVPVVAGFLIDFTNALIITKMAAMLGGP